MTSWRRVTDDEGTEYFVSMTNALKVLNEFESDGELFLRCEREDGETVDIIAKEKP